MRLKLDYLPEDFIDKYKLRAKVTKDGCVYVKICKGIYRLLQSGVLVHELLEKKVKYKEV